MSLHFDSVCPCPSPLTSPSHVPVAFIKATPPAMRRRLECSVAVAMFRMRGGALQAKSQALPEALHGPPPREWNTVWPARFLAGLGCMHVGIAQSRCHLVGSDARVCMHDASSEARVVDEGVVPSSHRRSLVFLPLSVLLLVVTPPLASVASECRCREAYPCRRPRCR